MSLNARFAQRYFSLKLTAVFQKTLLFKYFQDKNFVILSNDHNTIIKAPEYRWVFNTTKYNTLL